MGTFRSIISLSDVILNVFTLKDYHQYLFNPINGQQCSPIIKILMTKIASLAALLFVTSLVAFVVHHKAQPSTMSFTEYKKTHGITFDSQIEEKYRERVFAENVAKIEAHNSQNGNSYEMGINQFSHLTQEEFAETYLKTIVTKINLGIDETMPEVGDVDWVSKGAVTGVKNQGQCGSCWAFSTTGGIEGLYWLTHNNTLKSFSEQQLVDCSVLNMGCNGGLMDRAFTYVKNHGIVTEDQYPYTATKGKCTINAGDYKIKGFTDVSGCTNLANALTGRPISVAVDATNWSPYKSGVFNNCKTTLNHGVLLVGVSGGNWVIKNSWSATWGEQGFIRLASGNTCGICNQPSYPN